MRVLRKILDVSVVQKSRHHQRTAQKKTVVPAGEAVVGEALQREIAERYQKRADECEEKVAIPDPPGQEYIAKQNQSRIEYYAFVARKSEYQYREKKENSAGIVTALMERECHAECYDTFGEDGREVGKYRRCRGGFTPEVVNLFEIQVE